jgi:hypothetical protein
VRRLDPEQSHQRVQLLSPRSRFRSAGGGDAVDQRAEGEGDLVPRPTRSSDCQSGTERGLRGGGITE